MTTHAGNCQCANCHGNFPVREERCPHCGHQSFPNVREAEQEAEELYSRYCQAKAAAAGRKADVAVQCFEQACEKSKAAIARSLGEVFRLASSDLELYTTFYRLQALRVTRGIPAGAGEPNWDRIRAVADELLFGQQKEEVRFAALSLDGVGLRNYGECTLVLQDEKIKNRASVFEENSLIFMKRHEVTVWKSADLPRGYRSTWLERPKLCVAKCSDKLSAGSKHTDFAKVLLKQGRTALEDEFVEVHIFGPMTVLTLEKVIVHRGRRRLGKAKLSALREMMAKWKVKVECECER